MAGKPHVYEYNPVGLDAWDPKPHHPQAGARVTKISHKAMQAPKPMQGFVYVADADTGEPRGLVLRSSLNRLTKKNPNGVENPHETARVNGVVNDRRQ